LSTGSETPRGERTKHVRIVLVDDSDLVRGGFRRMLASEPDLEVIGEATNGREGVALCSSVRPDLVLMDVRMPEMDGLEATRRIKEEQPTSSVLVVTTYDNPDYLLEALKAGAAGYILKDAPKRQLINAIWRVINGESPLNQELAAQLIQRLAREVKEEAQSPPQAEKRQESSLEPPVEAAQKSLTPRELEVLRLLSEGQSNPQIARTLVISKATAKVHVERIIRKLGVSDRTQAAVYAIRSGLVTPESG
jgi:DNA-binding NarL/FixJ family response regulator